MGLRIHISESDARALQAACMSTGLLEHQQIERGDLVGFEGKMVGKNLHGEAFALLFNKLSNALEAGVPKPKERKS